MPLTKSFRTIPFLILSLFFIIGAGADPAPVLTLKAGDVRIEPRDDGYHLIVRQIPGLQSVMLAEAFELPDHKLATYSWRALEPNGVNSQEKRLLNGKFLAQPNLYLISSTVVQDQVFGPAFEVLIPPVVEYGSTSNPGARYGKVDIPGELATPDGKVWFSIRTFAKAFEDYTGVYKDNAFELSTIAVAQDQPPDRNKYVKGAEDEFKRLGLTTKAADPHDGVKILSGYIRDNRDLVLAIDTTKSMSQDLDAIRQDLVPQLETLTAGFTHFRMGFLFYRDYQELYLTSPVALTSDPAVWKKELDAAKAYGGGDVPEAAVEGIYAAAGLFKDPSGDSDRLLVVFADAGQHDVPRGKVTEGMALGRVKDAGASLRLILLPLTAF